MTDTDPQKGQIAEIAVCLVSGDLRQQIMIANLVIKIEELNELKTDEVIKRFTKSGLRPLGWTLSQDLLIPFVHKIKNLIFWTKNKASWVT